MAFGKTGQMGTFSVAKVVKGSSWKAMFKVAWSPSTRIPPANLSPSHIFSKSFQVFSRKTLMLS